MVDKVLGTFFTRLLSTILMIVVVIVNTNVFGAGGTGTIALVVLGLTILQVCANFVGGGTLVYLVPRKNILQLWILSFAWACVANVAGLCVLRALDLFPAEYTWWLLAMTFVFTVYNINVSVIQGKENIRFFNLLQLTQAVLLVAVLVVSLLVMDARGIELYLFSYIFSYLVVAIASSVYVAKQFEKPTEQGIFPLLAEMLKLGFWTQIANLTQLLTYRLNYYLIDHFVGRKPLGVFELGTRISEAVWIFPKSICLVQYARIANQPDLDYTKNLTLGFLKIVIVFAVAAVAVLALIPAQLLAMIFGPDFAISKSVILSLLPGIVFLSCNTILAHYFSGYGKYWVNAVGSAIGLAVTAAAGIPLIPKAMDAGMVCALQTAGWITSGAYFATLVWTMSVFVKRTHATLRDFLITRADGQMFIQICKDKFRNKSLKNS